MLSPITEAQWQRFQELGYLKLGRLEKAQLQKLQTRIDEIMLGKAQIDYSQLMMQLDSTTGAYEDAGPQSKGFKGPTLAYRKIEELEHDEEFLGYCVHPVFRDVCARVYGANKSVTLTRAMFMNKSANGGTFLAWHQDLWAALDRAPQISVWTALDPATKENGCVQVIPKSHQQGAINPGSSFLTKEQLAAMCTPERIVYLELEPGEVVLLHTHLLHASDANRSSQSRRAFSVCYMDADTLENGVSGKFAKVFTTEELTAELVGS